MRQELEQLYEIDLYLCGQLSDQQKAEFEIRLSTEPDLYDQLAVQQSVQQVVVASAYHDLRQRIKQEVATRDVRKRIKSNITAAIVSGFVIFSLFVLYQNLKPTFNSSEDKTTYPILGNSSPQTAGSVLPQPAVPGAVSQPKTMRQSGFNSDVTARFNPLIKPAEDISVEKVKVISDTMVEYQAKESKVVVARNDSFEPVYENEVAKINCSIIMISATPLVTPACNDTEDGEIDFRLRISGGMSPYKISTIKGGMADNLQIINLKTGIYDFTVSDSQGCSKNITVKIPSKACLNAAVTLNTQLAETWKVPFRHDRYTLRIVDKSGIEKFKQPSTNLGGHLWSGQDDTGNLLAAGMYIYTITYDDGSTDQGQVFIVP